MLGIKKLDIYVIKNFCMLFAGTFFVCLFVFMMQFLWRYVDELIGKGLTLDVMVKFFYYSGLTLIPMSLPLAILLAALISFGNMGEKFELLAIRAAGISLIKILRPLIFIVTILSFMSFYFQNVIGPASYIKLYTLLWSMKQTSPELEIPEGIFYNEIQGYNVYVKSKDKATGMLHDVVIYTLNEGFENARIILADSGRLDMSADKHHLILSLYSGEQFENLQSVNSSSISIPYRRETFSFKQTMIDFNSGFEMQNADFLSGNSSTKDIGNIRTSIDSMNTRIDSLSHSYYKDLSASVTSLQDVGETFLGPDEAKVDTTIITARATVPYDTLYTRLVNKNRQEFIQAAIRRTSNTQRDLEFKEIIMTEEQKQVARHWAEYYRKFSLSLACLMFFFIGAPLGAIIRKGGLGMPVIVSVIIFIIYYIIDNTAYRQALELKIPVWVGMWLSTFIMAPVGVFLTYKSNQDSVVFNMDAYRNFFRALLGLRTKRVINWKEVVIDTPDYQNLLCRLDQLEESCDRYRKENSLLRPPSYIQLFWRNSPDKVVEQISNELEDILVELGNSRDNRLVSQLNKFPILTAHAHTSPFETHWKNAVAGIILPIGIILYFRIWRFRMRLSQDMQQIIDNKKITQQLITDFLSKRKNN